MRGAVAQNARFRHYAARFAPIFIFLSSFERSQCPLSNEPKFLQIGQEMAELLGKTCEILTDLVSIYRLPKPTSWPVGGQLDVLNKVRQCHVIDCLTWPVPVLGVLI